VNPAFALAGRASALATYADDGQPRNWFTTADGKTIEYLHSIAQPRKTETAIKVHAKVSLRAWLLQIFLIKLWERKSGLKLVGQCGSLRARHG
jgi:hypothetical protein